jgi:predicted transcriptional regulator
MNIYITQDCIAGGAALKANKSYDIAPNIAEKLIARGYAKKDTGQQKAKPVELKEDY